MSENKEAIPSEEKKGLNFIQQIVANDLKAIQRRSIRVPVFE